jgi:hypothetical protein
MSAQAKRHAIGLLSTHFEAVAAGGIKAALLQNMLQVLYLLYAGGLHGAVEGSDARALLDLADASLYGRGRADLAGGIDSALLVPYLRSQTIRF